MDPYPEIDPVGWFDYEETRPMRPDTSNDEMKALLAVLRAAEKVCRNYHGGAANWSEQADGIEKLTRAVKAACKAQGRTFTVETPDA